MRGPARERPNHRADEVETPMSAITITVPDDRLTELKRLASRLRVTPEELVRVSLEDLLDRPDEAFEQAVDRVLKKNAELYRRLA